MKTYTKIKIKIALFDFLFNLIMWTGIFTCAYLNNKIIEAFFFLVCWGVFRRSFPKDYHFKHSKKPILNVLGCLFWSSVIFWIVIPTLLPVTTSIFASVVAGMIVNFLLYKFQDYLDLKKEVVKQTVNIYKMTEEELRNYAKSKGLSEMIIDTLVLRVIHNYRWVEIRNERNYSRRGIDYHKETIEKKLNIKL